VAGANLLNVGASPEWSEADTARRPLFEKASMSPTAGRQRDERRRTAPKGRELAHGLRAMLRTLHRWWARERYRPERRYMRG